MDFEKYYDDVEEGAGGDDRLACGGGGVRKTAGNRPLGRPRHRWESKIKMHLNVKGGHRLDSLGFRIEVSGGLL